jgi:hypothetical protein
MPGKIGTAERLPNVRLLNHLKTYGLPVINILNNFFSAGCSICVLQILVNPFDQMILENSFDKLVKDIRGEQFVDIRTRE